VCVCRNYLQEAFCSDDIVKLLNTDTHGTALCATAVYAVLVLQDYEYDGHRPKGAKPLDLSLFNSTVSVRLLYQSTL
jgi:hypothetical protein